MNDLVHPWNTRQAEALRRSMQQLPHAILLAGAPGLGKHAFAEWLSGLLLCEQPDASGLACNRCQGCRLRASGSHADLHVVQPESLYKNSDSLLARYALRYPPEDKGKDSKDSTAIRIDQIRALIESSHGRPQIARQRVMVLSPADRMNMNAANALLKLLEEPPPDSHLVLVADRLARLPATIRSRCVRIDFHVPETAMAVNWLVSQGVSAPSASELLALAGGAPLEALSLGKTGFLTDRDRLVSDLENLLDGKADPVGCAARWKEQGAERCLRWLQGWLADLVRPSSGPRHNPGAQARLQTLKKRLHLKQLFLLADVLGRSRGSLGGTLDEQLLLEEVLICWTELQTTPTS